ncbi:MAG: fructose-1,6-bisphosphatase [Lachnospiraceae bacterium]|nr:fructose-1,6-bisphosphatase [Lachnospiraceae bacterium]
MKDQELRYLQMLAEKYPTITKTAAEIINLTSIRNLPKGTEHILSDIHGEGEHFSHVLRNGSGTVRTRIDDVFENVLTIKDRKQLATLIYYPEEKLDLIEKEEPFMDEWYEITIRRLIQVLKRVAGKYTRSRVRKSLPKEYAFAVEELIDEKSDAVPKEDYYDQIIKTIVSTGRAREFVTGLSYSIQRLVIDHLHIVGDIFDRGPDPAMVMDILMDHHRADVQWGNHDVLWMGAAAGQPACVANVVRICARYDNLGILEDDYGINLIPLATMATNVYRDDPCTVFELKEKSKDITQTDAELETKMHKAISVIQFKLEGQTIARNPDFCMEDRMMLHLIDHEKGTITIGGKEYKLLDTSFPTIDPEDPYRLSEEEQDVIDRLIKAFRRSERLQKHVGFLFEVGSLYLKYNNILYYHGCVPMTSSGNFKGITLRGKRLKGKALYDYLDGWLRRGYYEDQGTEDRIYGEDLLWFTWNNAASPVFGKDRMATFERYFIAEKETHKETKNPYYKLIENEDICDKIMREFGMDPSVCHIINGHMPVKTKAGENPIKGGGKLIIIDGGFSRAYHNTTGIAGYTLVYNSYCLRLVTHLPFEGKEKAIIEETDVHSKETIVDTFENRVNVAGTDKGEEMEKTIEDLTRLLKAYREGIIREKK